VTTFFDDPSLAALGHDIAERREAERLLAMQDRVNAALSTGQPLEQLTARLLEGICSPLGLAAGAVWRIEESATKLRAQSFWVAASVSGSDADELRSIVDCESGDGLPWDVWLAAEPVWLRELEPNTPLLRERVAYRAGFRSAGAVPIRVGQQVLGVLEFFSEATGKPGPARLAQLEAVGLRFGRHLRQSRPAGPRRVRYKLDTRNTHLEFSCAFMKFMTVHGIFRDFSGWVEVEGDDPRTATGECTIKTASIDTRSVERDYHLCSEDFFAVERYPEMVFRASKIESTDGERFRILGDLTIREISRPIRLEVRLEDIETDASGTVRIMLTGGTIINRLDWVLDWEKALQAGRWIVGNEVRLDLVIALVRRAEAWELAR
jgi:polyisoprenoid-binding protein YceI